MKAGASPPPPPGVWALHVERFLAMTTCGPIVIATWTGPVPHDVPRSQRVLDEMKRLRKGTHAKLLLYVYLVSDDAVIPDYAARKVDAQLPEYFDACVGIHEGNSVRSSLIRAVVTGMAMMSRRQRGVMPQVVSTSAEAARELALLAGGQLDEAAILAAIEETRRLSLA
jgi:hypothetical protein